MNDETKFLIEQAATETKEKVFENINTLRKALSNYHSNLTRLKSFAESLGCSNSDVIEVINMSIDEIKQGKEKAMEGELFWDTELNKVFWERQQAKWGESDVNL